MGLSNRHVKRGIKKASTTVKKSEMREEVLRSPVPKQKQVDRHKEIPGPKHIEELPIEESEDAGSLSPTNDYIPIEVESSNGKRYKIMVPKSYKRSVPLTWKWTKERYRVAELIAMGMPFSHIPNDPEVNITSRMVIYGWLQHPEFKEHVDGITMETGFANKRERIAGLNRLTQRLYDKVIAELEGVKLTDKSIGPVLTAIQTTAKLIAQEKQEFIEESKITQDTTVTGTIHNVHHKLDDILQSKTEEERKALAEAFDTVGNDIIRAITGEKES